MEMSRFNLLGKDRKIRTNPLTHPTVDTLIFLPLLDSRVEVSGGVAAPAKFEDFLRAEGDAILAFFASFRDDVYSAQGTRIEVLVDWFPKNLTQGDRSWVRLEGQGYCLSRTGRGKFLGVFL